MCAAKFQIVCFKYITDILWSLDYILNLIIILFFRGSLKAFAFSFDVRDGTHCRVHISLPFRRDGAEVM